MFAPKDTSMLECYQLSVRFSNSGEVSKGCSGNKDARETIDTVRTNLVPISPPINVDTCSIFLVNGCNLRPIQGTREFVEEITYSFVVDQDQDVFIQVRGPNGRCLMWG